MVQPIGIQGILTWLPYVAFLCGFLICKCQLVLRQAAHGLLLLYSFHRQGHRDSERLNEVPANPHGPKDGQPCLWGLARSLGSFWSGFSWAPLRLTARLAPKELQLGYGVTPLWEDCTTTSPSNTNPSDSVACLTSPISWL